MGFITLNETKYRRKDMEKPENKEKKTVVITLEFTPRHARVLLGNQEIIRRYEEKTVTKEIYDKIKNIEGIKKLK